MITLPVVVAVDGSDDSLRALDWALAAARLRAAPLWVVHVRGQVRRAQPDVVAAAPAPSVEEPVLDHVRAQLADRQDLPATEYVACDGAVATVLPELGADAQLMVVGSRGRGGFASLILGSTSLAVAGEADCPVVVVPRPGREVHEGPPVAPGPRVVVGVDVDGPTEATLAFAFAEADRRHAVLHVISSYLWAPLEVWSAPGQMVSPDVEDDAVQEEIRTLVAGLLPVHRERHPDVRVELSTPPGQAAGLLVAASKDAELVVVGRHRRRLLAPARMIGSVTQAVLLHAASPVAVIPPAAEPIRTDG
ncbi:universal stress protein [Streptomyces sp. NPDC003631]|uniref:Universal stress protein n=1 Tax=Streptomyces lannensis TaxID=766498 RepID=A0ABP7K186_9ACTN